jgi:hypothetical protein
MSIDKSSFNPLFSYALLASGNIDFTGISAIINSGYYGTVTGVTITASGGSILTGGSPSGKNQASASSAITQLQNLKNTILSLPLYIVNINSVIGSTTQTYLPSIRYQSSTSVTYTNSVLNFDGQSDLTSQFFIIVDTDINMTGVTINLFNGAQSKNIFFLTSNGGINITSPVSSVNGTFISNGSITFNSALTTSSKLIYGTLYSLTGNVTSLSTISINAPTVCYLKGTQIFTENGYINIEDIKVGDKIASNGKIEYNDYTELGNDFTFEPVVWVGNFKAPNLTSKTFPICIKANSFGENIPFKDLYVSPEHCVLIDGKMLKAEFLVNGDTIYQDNTMLSVEYYHIELDTHSCIVANGILSESYRDGNNRVVFEHMPQDIPMQVSQPTVIV